MSTDELHLIWDSAPIGLARVARNGRFTSVNVKYCEILGYSETELLNRTFQQITHPDDLDPDVTEADHLANNPLLRSYQMVKRYISKDNRTVWVNMLVCAVRSDAGEFQHYFVFAIELTPIPVNSNDSLRATMHDNGGPNLLGYIKNNPKEAAVIVGAVVMLAQGKNFLDVLLSILGQKQ
jgi:PAS domain S-box-containing protein